MGSWVSWVPIGFRCLWIFMGVMAVYGCLLGFMDFWVSMGTYGWHECLWVLYLNIENISYFIIQEPQKIWKFQKTSEITHLLWKIAYGPRRRETLSTRVFSVLINKVPFSPLVHNILFYIKVVRRCFTVTRTTSRAVGKGWTHVWSKIARVNGGGGGGGGGGVNGPGKPTRPASTEFLPSQVTFCILVGHLDSPFRISEFWIQIRNQRPQKPRSTEFHPNRI